MNKGAELVLAAIDNSIEKWHKIAVSRTYVYNDRSMCPLCRIFDDSSACIVDVDDFVMLNFLPSPEACPIRQRTGMDDCNGTPFYGTSLWTYVEKMKRKGYIDTKEYLTKEARKADNRMLILLYEIRKEHLLYLIKKR